MIVRLRPAPDAKSSWFPLQPPPLRPPLSPAMPQGKSRPMVFRGGGGGGCRHFFVVAVVACLLSVLSNCHDGWALPSAIRPALDDYAVEGGARTRSTPNKIGNQAPLWHCSSGECWRKVPPPGSPGAGQPGQGIALRGVSGAACWRPMGGVFLGFSWEPSRLTA